MSKKRKSIGKSNSQSSKHSIPEVDVNNQSNSLDWISTFWVLLPFFLIFELLFIFVIAPYITPPANLAQVSHFFLKQNINFCIPEPLEQNRYIGGVIICFLFFFLQALLTPNFIFKNKWLKINQKFKNAIIAIAQLILLAFFIINWTYQADERYTYFENSTVTFLAAILIFVCFFYYKGSDVFTSLFSQKAIFLASIISAVLYLIIGLLPSIFTELNIGHSYLTVRDHLPYTYEEFSSVLNGHTPLVDFFPQYQYLLPLLTAPIFKLIGLNITTYTFTMFLLSLAAMVFAYFVFFRNTQSHLASTLLFIPFLAVSFIPINISAMAPQSLAQIERNYSFNYFAFEPLRTFGPWLVFFIFTYYLNKKTPKSYFILFQTATLTFINNIDLGLATLVASLLGVIFTIENKLIPQFKNLAFIISTFFGSLLISIGFYFSIIYFRTDQFPEINLWLSFQKAFAQFGFFMLPMPNLGIHLIIFVTFAVCIAWGLIGLSKYYNSVKLNPDIWADLLPDETEFKNRMAILFFSGVFGFGSSVYFVGRSHPWVLIAIFPFWMFSICLLLWEVYLFWQNHLRSQSFSYKFLHISPTLILVFIFCNSFQFLFDFISPFDQIDRFKIEQRELINAKTDIQNFIQVRNPDNQSMMLIYPYGHEISNLTGNYNYFPFAHQGSLILNEQIQKTLEIIKTQKVRKIFGVLPEELETALLQLGFQKKDTFVINSPLLQQIAMRNLDFWEI